MREAVPLEDRQRDYDLAERVVMEMAERWTEAKAGGRMTDSLQRQFDVAQQELIRAKRRLEKTQTRRQLVDK